MATYSFTSCGNNGNLTNGQCDFDLDYVVGAFLIPTGSFLTNAQLSTPKTTIQTNLYANNRATGRWFQIDGLGGFEEKGEGAKTDSIDNYKVTIHEGTYLWMFDFVRKGKCNHATLRNFNFKQQNYDVLFYDASYNLWGKNIPDANGLPQLGGFALHELYTEKQGLKSPTGKKNKYPIGFALANIKEFNDNFLYINLGFDPSNINNLKGLQDVTGYPLTGTAGSFTGIFTYGCLGTNLAATYGATLSAAGAWTAFNETLQSACTISAVALNAAGTGYTFTVATGSNVTGNSISIIMKAPSVITVAPYSINATQETKVLGTW